jgi:hypothetical protein
MARPLGDFTFSELGHGLVFVMDCLCDVMHDRGTRPIATKDASRNQALIALSWFGPAAQFRPGAL